MKNTQKKENLNFIQDQKSNENVYKLSEDEEEYEEIVLIYIQKIYFNFKDINEHPKNMIPLFIFL